MKKLSTIQKREKLNDIFATDEPGNGGANHVYEIHKSAPSSSIHEINQSILCTIAFQNGARNLEDSISGVIDTDLLEIARDRLQSFQAGPFASRENAIALTHIEEALLWLNKRVEDRIERNVLGTNNK